MNKQQIIAVILIGLGLLAGTFLIYRNQGLRVRSDNREGLGNITLEKGGSFGDVKELRIMISTGKPETGQTEHISSMSLKVQIGSENEEISILNDNQESANEVVLSKLVNDGQEWLVPVNSIYESEGKYFVELVLINTGTEGFSSITPTELGSIFVKTTTLNMPRTQIIREQTRIMSKGKPVVDILP